MSGPVIERKRTDGTFQRQSAVGSFRLGAGLGWSWDDDDTPLLTLGSLEQDDPEDVPVHFIDLSFDSTIEYSNLPDTGGTWAFGANNSLTLQGRLVTSASTATRAGVNLPHGTAPSSPVDGDLWSTTTGFAARVNGATVTLGFVPPLGATLGGTGTATVTTGDLLYGSATNTWSKLAASGTSSGPILRQASGIPSWTTATYPNTATSGGILYASATSVISVLTGFSSTNQLLIHNGTVPAWAANLPAARLPVGSSSTVTWDVTVGSDLTLTRGVLLGDWLEVTGSIGFFGTARQAKKTVSGARNDPEGALKDLLAKLAAYGLFTNSTTAT